MRKLENAPMPTSTRVMIWGRTPLISAIGGARTVTILAEVLPYPKIVAVNIVGINYIKQIKIMLKAAEMPNLATPTKIAM